MSDSPLISRRQLLQAGLGTSAGLWLPRVLPAELAAPHHRPRAKHVIMLYMSGGYSHVDTFDPKPELTKRHDQSIGNENKAAVSGQPKVERYLKAPLWKFRPNRECGTEVSDLFPEIRKQMHEVALIRSMNCDHRDHGEATLQLHTGSTTAAMPGMGAWLSYGLKSFNPNLPSHVVISEHRPYNGPQLWDANFLPAVNTGVRVMPGNDPIPYLKSPTSHSRQQLELSLLQKLNQRHLDRRDPDSELTGRMSTFKAASGLQRQAPEALDLSRESKSTLGLYGAAQGDQASYAAQCIMARRLIERGVRFVEIIDAVGACRDNWDAAHRDMASHEKYARRVDQPIAALITDLKQRGLFEETLLVFCTEFGRSPWAQDGKGTKSRTHHPNAFSCWLAGGNVRGGVIHGESDDIGNYVVKDLVHIHDFHATILHIMGLDHEQLTYRHAGRDFRLTDVHGHVVKQILHS
ncbi:DUF1501 domain-containing protein [Gimesia chilikensis]|uniref:DUF1501 domain-containing protein n=1 Tax=Gimesia chilikensis TaxID=2605989 RepID=A0A517PK23_9PLAN|nr:DUF1501 domain-containing protein [Gimesia chilikensis]QDT19707.1 hypothetical protein HG66A1_14750 [Gimesia chilikensis]